MRCLAQAMSGMCSPTTCSLTAKPCVIASGELQATIIVLSASWQPWASCSRRRSILYGRRRLPRGASLLGLVGATLLGWFIYERFKIATLAVYLPAFAAGIAISATNFDPGPRAAAISLAAFALTSAAILGLPITRLLVVDPPRVDPAEALSFFWMLPLTPYIAHSLARGSGPLDRIEADLAADYDLTGTLVRPAVWQAVIGGGLPPTLHEIVLRYEIEASRHASLGRRTGGPNSTRAVALRRAGTG